MKNIVIAFFIIVSMCSYAQLSSIVKDAKSLEPIPYVNIRVENKSKGTSSNENGTFKLNVNDTDTIVFSAIGYETKRLMAETIGEEVLLKPITTTLETVVLRSKKEENELVIGTFRKSTVKEFQSLIGTRYNIGKFFNFEDDYEKTPFLKRAKILTKSKIKEAKFMVKFYSATENGEVGKLLHSRIIIGTAKKGKRFTSIDLSNYNIEFPTTGLFIAIEFIKSESNRHYISVRTGNGKKVLAHSYQPKIGTILSETNFNSWKFGYSNSHRDKVWTKVSKNIEKPNENRFHKKYENKYSLLAVELTLTD